MLTQKLGRNQSTLSVWESSVRYSPSSALVVRQVKYV